MSHQGDKVRDAITSITSYAKFAERTENRDYSGPSARAGGAIKWLHYVLGVTTEFFELEAAINQLLSAYQSNQPESVIKQIQTNITEEIGDVCYYLSLLSRYFEYEPCLEFAEDMTLHDYMNLEPEAILNGFISFRMNTMSNAMHNLVDEVKRFIYYDAKSEVIAKVYLDNITMYLMYALSFSDAETLKDAMHRNYLKLSVRYPAAFTEELAVNRDLKAELEALRGGKSSS